MARRGEEARWISVRRLLQLHRPAGSGRHITATRIGTEPLCRSLLGVVAQAIPVVEGSAYHGRRAFAYAAYVPRDGVRERAPTPGSEFRGELQLGRASKSD